jgi:flagellar basal-body rod protein FlgG
MVRGLYTAAAGMMAQQARLDTISNNLANAETAGFRRDEAVFRSFPEMLLWRLERDGGPIGTAATGCVVEGVFTSGRQGGLRETGNALDIALIGDVFLAVRGGDGEVYYTRNGSFTRDGSGRLVTGAGNPVLGVVNGNLEEIYLPDGELVVDTDGALSGAFSAAGEAVERLALVRSGIGQGWRKVGDSLFQGQPPAEEPDDYQVRQGYLEASNVNPVEEMVGMIAAMRAYEMNQKAIQAADVTLEKAVNEVGRV